ncbi:unnamed protein product [Somion occarium]|uniref:GIY-YIG homing endonuclease n=1 Tax=Somion occarium TaxID=3059160 RepID=A0ABP1D744_9APHY
MLQRTAKRLISTKAADVYAERQAATALRQKAELLNEPPPPSGVEEVKITKRRIGKAERDERMDITLALTPVRTYMGGFTRPTDLRASNWTSGGRYNEIGKIYHPPPAAAYEPHTVFLLESRYNVVHGIGRADCHDHIVGVCRESDFPAVLKKLNSSECGHEYMESMDNARWPFLPPKKVKHVKWWESGENPEELVRQALEGEADGETKRYSEPEPPVLPGNRSERRALKLAMRSRKVPTELLPVSGSSAVQIRTFYSSSRVLADEKTSRSDRASIPGSSWARPHKPSQDADDNVVPTYYVERKKQRASISERKEEEGGLMAELSAGILSDGVAAQTRVIPEKIPVEVRGPDGSVRHPSGFEPPTPETEFHPSASKIATEEDPMLTTIKIPWDSALAPEPEGIRGFHTSAVARASEVPIEYEHVPQDAPVEEAKAVLKRIREQYLPTLSKEPFWRPLLSLTFSTRPIALTISRLAKSHPRGLPFYASINDHDRKFGPSYDARIRNMRLERMAGLTIELAKVMSGERGGIIGVRFKPEERGRGIDGEGLDDKIPLEKRIVKIGVGEWYPLANEVKEAFQLDGEAAGDHVTETLQIFGLDEFGNRTDGVAWPESKTIREGKEWYKSVEKRALANLSSEEVEKMTPKQRKEIIGDYCREHKVQIAYDTTDRHHSVYYP